MLLEFCINTKKSFIYKIIRKILLGSKGNYLLNKK